MNKTTWNKDLLAIIIATGVVCSHVSLLRAQDAEADNAAGGAQQATAVAQTQGVNSAETVYTADAVETTNTEAQAGMSDVATNVPSANATPQTRLRDRGPVVVFGGTAEVKKGESAETLVAIGGSAKAGGNVRDAVVAIGGNAEAEGNVGDAVVAIGGDALAKGKVGDAVVAIAGNAEAQGQVGDAVVAIMGNVKIGTNSSVGGDVVSVGGKVEIAEGAQVKGQVVEVGVGQVPFLMPLKGLAQWFRYCVLKLRLLAPQAGWAWVVAGIYLLLYLLVAVAFPRPVAACVNELTNRPATTFLFGLLTKLLIPLVMLVLTMTGIGVFIVPFVMAAVFFGAIVGKAALLEYLGRQIFRVFGVTIAAPVLALLIGWVMLSLLYMVPVLSLLIFGVTSVWAIGVAVTAAFGGARKETPSAPTATPTSPAPTGLTPPSPGIAPMPVSHMAPVSTEEQGAAATDQQTEQPSASQQTAQPLHAATPIPEALALKRAGFWERMGAGFLDIILVSILGHFVGGPPWGFLVALAYFAGMWTWRGTTVGGIVLNLKVVRYDGRPVDFAVSLVRALGAAFSVVVFFLGFLWIAFDREKQGWHDKIAGTVVVRQSRATPLVCL